MKKEKACSACGERSGDLSQCKPCGRSLCPECFGDDGVCWDCEAMMHDDTLFEATVDDLEKIRRISEYRGLDEDPSATIKHCLAVVAHMAEHSITVDIPKA